MSPIRAIFNGKIWLCAILPGWIGLGVVLAQEISATPEATATPTTTGLPTVTWTMSPTVTPTWTDVPPTRTVLPTATSTTTPTVTESPPGSVTPTATITPVSATPEPTRFIPPTAQVITQIVPLVMTAPPLIITQMVTNPAPPTMQPPPRIYPTIERTARPSELYGWSRSESIVLVQVSGNWYLRQNFRASAGAFHETLNNRAILRLPFEGEGIRVGFIAHKQGGYFRLLLDGEVIGEIDTFSPEEAILQTAPAFVTSGYHVLDIVAVLPSNTSRSVAIDTVDVFNGPPQVATATVIVPTIERRIALTNIQLVSRPIEPQPSPTAIPERPVSLDVIVGYDLNANQQIEPREGVRGLSIRVVDARDNTLLASVFTDAAGFAHIETVVSGDVVILIPLLGETLHLRRGSRQSSWVLRLDAVNVPGLIP